MKGLIFTGGVVEIPSESAVMYEEYDAAMDVHVWTIGSAALEPTLAIPTDAMARMVEAWLDNGGGITARQLDRIFHAVRNRMAEATE